MIANGKGLVVVRVIVRERLIARMLRDCVRRVPDCLTTTGDERRVPACTGEGPLDPKLISPFSAKDNRSTLTDVCPSERARECPAEIGGLRRVHDRGASLIINTTGRDRDASLGGKCKIRRLDHHHRCYYLKIFSCARTQADNNNKSANDDEQLARGHGRRHSCH